MAEKEDDLVQKLESMPKPIFSPTKKSAQQQQQQPSSAFRNNKYSKNLRIWMDTLKLPYYSSSGLKASNHFGLENIPEEETLLGDHQHHQTGINNKNESSILMNSYAVESTPPQRRVAITSTATANKQTEQTTIIKQNGSSNCAMEHPLLQKTNNGGTEHDSVEENECKYVNNKLSDLNPHVASGHHAVVPIYKKKHLKRAFDKPGEDKNLALGIFSPFFSCFSVSYVL